MVSLQSVYVNSLPLVFAPLHEKKVHDPAIKNSTMHFDGEQLLGQKLDCCNVNELPEAKGLIFSAQFSFPISNFLKISVAEKMQLSMMPATVNVPPTIAHTVVRKW